MRVYVMKLLVALSLLVGVLAISKKQPPALSRYQHHQKREQPGQGQPKDQNNQPKDANELPEFPPDVPKVDPIKVQEKLSGMRAKWCTTCIDACFTKGHLLDWCETECNKRLGSYLKLRDITDLVDFYFTVYKCGKQDMSQNLREELMGPAGGWNSLNFVQDDPSETEGNAEDLRGPQANFVFDHLDQIMDGIFGTTLAGLVNTFKGWTTSFGR